MQEELERGANMRNDINTVLISKIIKNELEIKRKEKICKFHFKLKIKNFRVMYPISSLSRGSNPRTIPGEFSPPRSVSSWQPCAHHVHPSLWTVVFLRQLEQGGKEEHG